MEKYFVTAIGNAVVDVTISVSFDEMKELGIGVGEAGLIDLDFKKRLEKLAEKKGLTISSGGSIANSVYTISSLGQKSAFIGTLGKDNEGQGFYKDFLNSNISMSAKIFKNKLNTATCYVLITPDAERAMQVFLGDAATIKLEDDEKKFISSSDVLLLEMYPVANDEAYNSIKEACKISKSSGKKIAMSFSDLWVVESCRERVLEFEKQSDMIFANENEAKSFSGTQNKEDMIEFFKSKKENKDYIITLGSEGVVLIQNGECLFQPSFKVTPIDLTGAGDMFLASYLFGISEGATKAEALKKACYMSSKVICQIGARLHEDVKKVWNYA